MNPFIPSRKANLAIVDGRASEEILGNLRKLGLRLIKTVRCQEVDESIAYHPDIVIHPINHNTLIVAPNVFHYYEDKLAGLGIELIRGEKYLDCKYPEDIAYNVGRLDGIAIHDFRYTDRILKYYLEKEGLRQVNVKQGYSKCSLAIVNNNKAITADLPIYKELSSLGFDVLLIQPGHIDLEGQEYGFIGGATGNLNKNNILFSGSLEQHPDKEEIVNYIGESKAKINFLSEKKILDIGTIITLYCQ